MPFFQRTKDEIIQDSLQRLSNNTNITQLSPGGKTRFFLETFGEEQEKQNDLFNTNLLQVYIKYAGSRFLDFFGDMLKVPRLEPAHASTETQNFFFYVSSGTFGDINGGASFSIPAGTVVSTVQLEEAPITPGLSEQPVIQYTTTSATVCNASESFVFTPIRASVEGFQSNVPRNVINSHSFSSYTLSQQSLLKCTNKYSIDTGEERESDDSYRFRLQNVFRARNTALLTSVRLAALSINGVSDVEIVQAEQGPATYSIYVVGLTPTVSPRLLSEVAIAVNAVTAFGIRPFVVPPTYIGFEFVASVTWSPRATSGQISAGYAAMRDSVEEFFNGIALGDAVLFSDVVDTMLEAAPLAQSIGANEPNKFEEIYTVRTHPTGTGVIRDIIIAKEQYLSVYNEKLILETSGRYRGIRFLTR